MRLMFNFCTTILNYEHYPIIILIISIYNIYALLRLYVVVIDPATRFHTAKTVWLLYYDIIYGVPFTPLLLNSSVNQKYIKLVCILRVRI